LIGSIPTELGKLSQLKYLFLNSNKLTGSIPSELINLTQLYLLNLSSNQLAGFIPNLKQPNPPFLIIPEQDISTPFPPGVGVSNELILSNNQCLYTNNQSLLDFIKSHDTEFTNCILAEVQSTTGQSFSLTPIAYQDPTTSEIIPDTSAILTQKNSTTTLNRGDNSIMEIKQETIVVLNPVNQITNINTLIRGEVTITIDCNNASDYELLTAIANIKVSGSCSSEQKETKFTANYSQDGVDGELTVKVILGTLDVTDRNENIYTLIEGDEKVIQDNVPRTSWVLPINKDKIYGGKDNFFIWTEYPEADSYMLELNIPEPVFSEQNASTTEFPDQTATLTSKNYIKYDDLIVFILPLPKGADGMVIEMRLFALDEQGKIIGETVASDSCMITIKD